MFKLSKKSLAKLSEVNPDLQKLVKNAIGLSTIDFGISEGMRTRDRQQILYDTGKSQTMNSRHLTGHAVDVYAWKDGGTCETNVFTLVWGNIDTSQTAGYSDVTTSQTANYTDVDTSQTADYEDIAAW